MWLAEGLYLLGLKKRIDDQGRTVCIQKVQFTAHKCFASFNWLIFFSNISKQIENLNMYGIVGLINVFSAMSYKYQSLNCHLSEKNCRICCGYFNCQPNNMPNKSLRCQHNLVMVHQSIYMYKVYCQLASDLQKIISSNVHC